MEGLALTQYANLGTRQHFNQTLKHLISVTGLIDSINDKGVNLADSLNDFIGQGVIDRSQVLPIISVIFREKLEASYRCCNLLKNISDPNSFAQIVEVTAKWNAIDMVCVYHHPNIGVAPINPANMEHWEIAQELRHNELMIVYARSKNGQQDKAKKAIDAFYQLLMGEKPQEDADFIISAAAQSEPIKKTAPALQPQSAPKPEQAPAPVVPTVPTAKKAKMQLTPKYSVQVTNELFHNGNVEAWKNIIESYQLSHPETKVIVYHEGELIQDLNSLFKWGKVKHGGLIFFQVSGTKIKDVSRLQKYLAEAASKRYETFMKHDVNKALHLF